MFFDHKEQPRTLFYSKVATTFVVLSLLLVGIVFYISFSWATIILTPQDQYVDNVLSIRVAEKTNDEEGVVRGRIMTEELEVQGTFIPEASSILTQKATGVIVVVNTTSKDQVLRETTRLLASDGTLFRNSESVTVGARQSKEVSVVADKEGEDGAVLQSRFILPGLWPGLQDKIYGQGFEPREGGSRAVRILSQSDVDKAKESLIAKLKEKFINLTQNPSGSADFRPKNPQSILQTTVLSSSLDKALGAQVDTFTLRLKSQITGVVFDQDDVKAYAEQVFRKELQSGYDLIGLDISQFQYNLDDIDRVGNKARLSLKTSSGKIKSADYLALEKKSLVGKTAGQVLSYFESMSDISDVRVQFYPFWVTRTPLLHDHIHIIVQKKLP